MTNKGIMSNHIFMLTLIQVITTESNGCIWPSHQEADCMFWHCVTPSALITPPTTLHHVPQLSILLVSSCVSTWPIEWIVYHC